MSFAGFPPNWTRATLPDVVGPNGAFSDGDWIESKDQDQTGNVRLIQLADIGDGMFLDRSHRFLRQDQAERLGCTFLAIGDILVARMPDPLGRACIFPGVLQAAVTAVDVCIVRPGKHSVDAYWLMWVLNAPTIRRAVSELQSGTTRKRISRRHLGEIEIPIAPRREQSRIVAEIEKQFTRLDVATASLARAQASLARYRASVLKAACEGRLVPTEAEVARAEGREYEAALRLLEENARVGGYDSSHAPGQPATPEGWCWATLGNASAIQGGILKNPGRAPRRNPHPFLRVANVGRGSLDLSEIHEVEIFEGELEKWRLATGDLLIVEGNGSASEIGRMAQWKGEIADCVHQNHIIRARPSAALLPSFVEIYWNSPLGQDRVKASASSTSGLFTLSAGKVSRLPVLVAPLAEQRRIVAEVDRRLSLADQAQRAIESALARALRLRQAILQRAFEGKLVPQDPSDEPASVLLERIRKERENAVPTKAKRGRRNASA